MSGKPNPSAKCLSYFNIHGGGYVVISNTQYHKYSFEVRYVSLSTSGMDGADLVREAGGGIVAVEVEYRLEFSVRYVPPD